ncbi:hypothetical protein [Pseudomonas baetica]|uniref:hypothetical protein n=1 Tax=Pseudomonas baetica TaxID=674054 RepID=UPI002870E6AB|nr:hypothetical protein [Pseudomonas baetica]MDR9862520.1 hypothetical protein [Pseudomonas baetica]
MIESTHAPSTLDFSFGEFGTRILEGTEVKAIAILTRVGPDQGKIVGVINGTNSFKLFRLDKKGLLDTTFGPDGTGYSEDRFGAPGSFSTPSTLTIVNDDQILVTGHVRDSSLAPHYPAVALFNRNGSANLLFGKFKFDVPPPSPPQATASLFTSATITDAVKILVSFNNSAPGPCQHWGLVLQLTLDGKLDTALDGRGYIFFRYKGQDTSTVGVAAQVSGRIVLAGSTADQGFIAGYTSTGQPDPTFGKEGGITAFSSSEGPVRVTRLLLQTDDRLIAVGAIAKGDSGWVTRKLRDGTDDISFNDGKDVISKIAFRKLRWSSAVIDPEGSIVMAGEVDTRLTVVGRITRDGQIDTSFSTTGLSNPNTEHTPHQLSDVGVQITSRIVVVGRKTNQPSVTRYHG